MAFDGKDNGYRNLLPVPRKLMAVGGSAGSVRSRRYVRSACCVSAVRRLRLLRQFKDLDVLVHDEHFVAAVHLEDQMAGLLHRVVLQFGRLRTIEFHSDITSVGRDKHLVPLVEFVTLLDELGVGWETQPRW